MFLMCLYAVTPRQSPCKRVAVVVFLTGDGLRGGLSDKEKRAFFRHEAGMPAVRLLCVEVSAQGFVNHSGVGPSAHTAHDLAYKEGH